MSPEVYNQSIKVALDANQYTGHTKKQGDHYEEQYKSIFFKVANSKTIVTSS